MGKAWLQLSFPLYHALLPALLERVGSEVALAVQRHLQSNAKGNATDNQALQVGKEWMKVLLHVLPAFQLSSKPELLRQLVEREVQLFASGHSCVWLPLKDF